MGSRDDAVTHVASADVVIPIGAPPLDRASVATRNGLILEVGDREHILRRYPEAEERRWAGVLMPGLVNAHTHLQYTLFAELGATKHAGFEEWSVAFDHVYRDRSETEDWLGAAVLGAGMALRSGTTTIADICTDIAAMGALRDAGLSGYSFFEALGCDWVEWANGSREQFLDQVNAARASETGSWRVGISPHAPYSLDTPVLADIAAISRASGMRLHTHLAESEFEDVYYRAGIGPLADFVATFRPGFEVLADGGTGLSSAEFASQTGLLDTACHVAHGIYLDAEGRSILRDTCTPVALCPRSNATIGLSPPPIADYLSEGNSICIGTDSLSSSPSLDLLEDVRLLRDLAIEQGYDAPDLSSRLLAAATVGGADALGMDRAGGVGLIESGRRADFAVFSVDTSSKEAESYVVAAGAGNCTATIVGGELRFAATRSAD